MISNFRRFGELDCRLGQHLVIAGPNSCGKTTLLQAVAFWSEIASHWAVYNPDLARDGDGNYPTTTLNLLRVASMPLAEWDHLWPARDVARPASLRLEVGGNVLGFELIYGDRESVHVRPTRDSAEPVLEQYLREPFRPVYIPPMSGLDFREPKYGSEMIPARLARGQGGTVLRNLLLAVSSDAKRWHELTTVVSDLFGYELTFPSAGAETIIAGYREENTMLSFDYSSGAGGFLQVVMLYAAIFQRGGSVVLIDEPDAHLHVFLQERLYRDLTERARREGWQLIVATHSERLIRSASVATLRLLAGGLRSVRQARGLVDTLHLDNMDLLLAQQVGRVLYLEGKTDLDILLAWSRVLQHPLTPFLEKPFWKPTAEDEWKAARHFQAMRLNTPRLRGAELCDRNDRGEEVLQDRAPEGMMRLVWRQYEIENYLVHPEALQRWVASRGGAAAARRAEDHMRQLFPPALFAAPFGRDYFEGRKGKSVLREVCQAARLQVGDAEYWEVAAGMQEDEVHPEVVEKLDAIAEQLFNGV